MLVGIKRCIVVIVAAKGKRPWRCEASSQELAPTGETAIRMSCEGVSWHLFCGTMVDKTACSSRESTRVWAAGVLPVG